METQQGAAEALASIARTRAAIGWSGYPAWYWLVMAGVLAMLPVSAMLPSWRDAAASLVLAVTGVVLAVATTKMRGVKENRRGSLPIRDGLLVVGPALAAICAGAATRNLWPWSPLVVAVLVFAWVATTALVLRRRRATAR
ncbi:MAG: hypothetical protein WBA97_08690 [Actinophytocola sp.]|uniref:hypothetical protein n=1 Tax=Actinophytocola sp. TaxID=1872138 RepID=UPI003C73042A